jgi:S-formylglutathione hydrolase FrmB
MLPPSFDSQKERRYPVLYYLHGLGDNEQSLVNGGGWEIYERLLQEKKIGEYLIVTPAGFRTFYVNSRDGRVPYEDFFFQEFVPAIERRYRAIGTRATRGVMGVSMGGFGALRYAFSRPTMFASVSAHMPALSEDVPTSMSSVGEQRMLQAVFGSPQNGVVDEVYYKRISPLNLAANAAASQLKSLAIYFDCGTNDDYGFDLGNETLHKTLERRGIKHEFHIYPGAHNWTFVMQHFGASLAFHSKALGAQTNATAAKR